MHRLTSRLLLVLLAFSVVAVACGGSSGTEPTVTSSDASSDNSADGVRIVSATEGASILDNAPEDLVVLDVRTPEEFAEGHIEGAIMVDFYSEDFAAQLAELDPDVPYLLYCRSGNRSGQTAPLLEQLGFDDVADVNGGIVAWEAAGLPTVAG